MLLAEVLPAVHSFLLPGKVWDVLGIRQRRYQTVQTVEGLLGYLCRLELRTNVNGQVHFDLCCMMFL